MSASCYTTSGDTTIARGAEIILAANGHLAKKGTFFAREVEYLLSKGYMLSEDGLRMFAPAK